MMKFNPKMHLKYLEAAPYENSFWGGKCITKPFKGYRDSIANSLVLEGFLYKHNSGIFHTLYRLTPKGIKTIIDTKEIL
jgi:hypothetical protein